MSPLKKEEMPRRWLVKLVKRERLGSVGIIIGSSPSIRSIHPIKAASLIKKDLNFYQFLRILNLFFIPIWYNCEFTFICMYMKLNLKQE